MTSRVGMLSKGTVLLDDTSLWSFDHTSIWTLLGSLEWQNPNAFRWHTNEERVDTKYSVVHAEPVPPFSDVVRWKVLMYGLFDTLFVFPHISLWRQSLFWAKNSSKKVCDKSMSNSIRLIHRHELDPEHLACFIRQRLQGKLRGEADFCDSNHVVAVHGSCWPLITRCG